MADPVRVMLEHGKKKRDVASAFDWPGWDRSTKKADDVLAVLGSYRDRYADVAARAGFGEIFGATDGFEVVEEVDGIGMTDYYGLSGVAATSERSPMSDDEADRKIALLRACWQTFDETAARVTDELRKGPRGGGWEKERIIRHVNGAEITEFAPKVGVKLPLETRDDPGALSAYRDQFLAAIAGYHQRGEQPRTWTLQFLIRRCAWHMLDHAWELEDRDLSRSEPLTAG